ncbi:MAG: hypothetical protein AB8G99_07355 [Planctomycetaceae bacterium]
MWSPRTWSTLKESLGGPRNSGWLRVLNSILVGLGSVVFAATVLSFFTNAGYYKNLKPDPNRLYKYKWVGIRNGWYRHEYGSGDLHPDALSDDGIRIGWEPYPDAAALHRPHKAGLRGHFGYPLVRSKKLLSRQRGHRLHLFVIKIWWLGYSLPILGLQLFSIPLITMARFWLAASRTNTSFSQTEA